MFIKVPIYLTAKTGVEGIRGESTVGEATVNTDNIVLVYPDADDTCNMISVSGDSFLIDMSKDDFDDLLESYEITIYEN